MKFDDLKYLAVPLPEDILKEKWAGYFDRARRIIDCRLADETTPYALRARLELELKNLADLEMCYTITQEEAMRQIHEKAPEMSEADLDQLRIENKVDWIYLNGEVRYLRSFCATLFNVYPELQTVETEAEACEGKEGDAVDQMLEKGLRDGDVTGAHIHIKHETWLEPDAVREGETLYVHMPFPTERGNVKNIKLITVNPAPKKMPDADEYQPTVYFEEKVTEDLKFTLEYELDHVFKYTDTAKIDLQKVAETPLPEDVKVYTEEYAPHIIFTPYLKALAEELKGGETNPLLVARRFYDWITTQVQYRFVREYRSIDNLPEYCGINRRGDCGIQGLLFITLCRISGIPAKWESGLDAKPDDVGEHDWAVFYIPSVGWLHCDPSYGGSAWRRGAVERWNYFFGNCDPFRIPHNSEMMKEFVPAGKNWRVDPYDNQCGEAEYEDWRVPGDKFNYKYTDLGIWQI